MMQPAPLPRKRSVPAEHYFAWLAGASLLVALSVTTRQHVTLPETAYASVLLSIAIQAYLSWRRGTDISLPIWALVCGAHFVFYGLAIFGALRKSPSMFDHGRDLPDSAIATAMR